MGEVQDMPESDDEEDSDSDADEEDDDDEVDEGSDEADQNGQGEEPFDEVVFQKQVSDRLEALRLHKALGNDDSSIDNSDPNPQHPSFSYPESDLDSESESTDSEKSTKPPPSDYTSYAPSTRNNRRQIPRLATKQLNDIDELKATVEKQVEKDRKRNERKFHHSQKGVEVGRGKGHKWKASDKYLVGKSGDGW